MSRTDRSTDRSTKPIYRMLLLGATLAVVIPLMQAMVPGALPAGPIRTLLLLAMACAALLAARAGKRALDRRAAVRRVTEFLRFFDDMSLLRPRAHAARAMLAESCSNDVERRSLVAVSQCLGELARAVHDGGPEGRSSLLAHAVVGAWFRALAVTTIPLSFDAPQREALQQLFKDVGAATNRRDPLDEGSRALLERDAVMFRSEEAEARIF